MKRFFVAIAAVVCGISVLTGPSAGAVSIYKACTGNDNSTVCASRGDNVYNVIRNVINVLLTLVGIIAVIMIIIGGIKYATSNGDPQSVKSAKDTVLYAVIGLVVAICALAIVNFTVDRFLKNSTPSQRPAPEGRPRV